ncbi:MAG: hypothetical protein WCW03_02430 [Candidatus Paceibacterota bacterium]|jgi:hypothetical protein
MTNKWRNIVGNAREKYKKMQPVACPAFGGELVYFNKHGFNHLIRKGRRFRKIDVQIDRIQLIGTAIDTLQRSSTVYRYRKVNTVKSVMQFWAFEDDLIIDNKKVSIIVVVRKMNNGKIHFFSIFKRKHKTP